jgi:hypothetical protein
VYSEGDLRDAVAAGAISAEAAQALRDHVSAARHAPLTDEESFRLVNSFNDIFVTIAAVLLLVAMAGIGNAIGPAAGGVLVAAASWGMAEFFTRRRRMALPSIVLLLGFVGGIVAAGVELIAVDAGSGLGWRMQTLLAAGIALAAAVGAWFHWRRFKVPITVAAGAGEVGLELLLERSRFVGNRSPLVDEARELFLDRVETAVTLRDRRFLDLRALALLAHGLQLLTELLEALRADPPEVPQLEVDHRVRGGQRIGE